MVKGSSWSRVLQENTKSCWQFIKQFSLNINLRECYGFPCTEDIFFVIMCMLLFNFSLGLIIIFLCFMLSYPKTKERILNQGQNWTTTCTFFSAIIIIVLGSLEIQILMFSDFFETAVCLYNTSTFMYELVDNKYCIFSIKHHR